jgi:hypothetical protein
MLWLVDDSVDSTQHNSELTREGGNRKPTPSLAKKGGNCCGGGEHLTAVYCMLRILRFISNKQKVTYRDNTYSRFPILLQSTWAFVATPLRPISSILCVFVRTRVGSYVPSPQEQEP